MKKFVPLFAVLVAILTACPTPAPRVGTAIATGGTVASSDSNASLTATSAATGTFVNVVSSSDQGQIPGGLTFVSAYNFQVTAGSVASATVSIKTPAPSASSAALTPSKGVSTSYSLYKRDGDFWRYVTGQTSTNTAISATVSSFGVYAILRGVATIQDIVVSPSDAATLNTIIVGTSLQFSAVVRDTLEQTIPNEILIPINWFYQEDNAFPENAPLQSQAVAVKPVNTIDASGLFTARKATTGTITATTDQNVKKEFTVIVKPATNPTK